jgi:hypothetical protein
MTDLDNAIRRIELRSEQHIIHLRSMQRGTRHAKHIKSVLFLMLVGLVALKGRRQHLEEEVNLRPFA